MAVCSSSTSSASSGDEGSTRSQQNTSDAGHSHVKDEESQEEKRARRRMRVCQEIMSTELTYQNHINLIVEVWFFIRLYIIILTKYLPLHLYTL